MVDIEGLIKGVAAGKTARSSQREIGPSEIGLCRRKLWYRLNNQPVTNDLRFHLSAFMGNAIHTAIEQRLKAQGFTVELEVSASHNGIPLKGHIDCYMPDEGLVIDWKTITKRKRAMFPSTAQRFQVQLYGWLLQQNGYRCDEVALVGICRDGTEDDIVIHREPFSLSIVEWAFDWLQEATGSQMPRADCDPKRFCANYCQFYDATGEAGCRGLR